MVLRYLQNSRPRVSTYSGDRTCYCLFRGYDLSRDKVLDVSEFVPLAYEISRKPVDATEQIFRRMDLNNDRTVDASEIAVARKAYDSGLVPIFGLVSIIFLHY
ncbi:unnamed protein product [Angiostrongylus costaricensis]|uniref:EF-hand domain-containing protein n=1 Tax=Angiostrongylus costaricensis TaxID=334426 RepID=A0A0R3PF15_ANGCS|nr:unnamed protein product [Angiostrongylus costaricensis]